MERRKFIATMGSIAAGGAATVGTGAFTSVTADRDVSVNVAGDANAYLGLTPASGPNGEYADGSGSEVAVDFSQIDNDDNTSGTQGGSGVNPDATTDIDSVLTITNQGTQEVSVSLTDNMDPEVSAELDPDASDYNLSPGDSVDVDFSIDTTGGYSPSGSQTLTITANATS